MAKEQKNKYFVKKEKEEEWADICSLFPSVNVLTINGINALGDAVNVYNEQWVNSKKEDYMVGAVDGKIVRKNVDISLTFICGQRYGGSNTDTMTVYQNFVDYMCSGDVYILSKYANKSVHAVSLKGCKTTTERLHRGKDSYIMGSIDFHLIEPPASESAVN